MGPYDVGILRPLESESPGNGGGKCFAMGLG